MTDVNFSNTFDMMLAKSSLRYGVRQTKILVSLIPVPGDSTLVGDDDTLRRLRAGDVWAWCCVEVQVTLLHRVTGVELASVSQFMDFASYKSEEEVRQTEKFFFAVRSAMRILVLQLEIAATQDATEGGAATWRSPMLKQPFVPEVYAITSSVFWTRPNSAGDPAVDYIPDLESDGDLLESKSMFLTKAAAEAACLQMNLEAREQGATLDHFVVIPVELRS